MAATKIMIIRHAERPPDDGSTKGVSPAGETDDKELIVRGWQRAGALVRFFSPQGGRFADPHLATPDVIFASKVAHHSPSLRPQHTVESLADFVHKPLVLKHAKGEEDALVVDVLATNGVVLIAWEHELIPDICNLITKNKTTAPQKWHGSRYDLVWVLDRAHGADSWTFTEVPQMLLPGDSN